jgi:hypothetical protein
MDGVNAALQGKLVGHAEQVLQQFVTRNAEPRPPARKRR